MFNQLVETVQSVSTLAAKATVGGAGAVVGGVTGLVVGTITGAVMGTATGAKAGCEMALGMCWPKSDSPEGLKENLDKAGAIVIQSRSDIQAEVKAEIRAIQNEMRGLAGPAGKPKKGPGRPKKAVAIDHNELDDQEVRDYMADKTHLRPDPIF